VVVGVSGLVSGVLVVSANAWMNCPSGFDYVNGQYIHIDPIAALFNKAWFSEALHMSIAAFAATGFAVAGIHALMILKGKNVVFHTKSFKIAVVFAASAAILQPFSGDISAKFVARTQPAKLAAMEAHFQTEKAAPLIIGGIPDVQNQKVDYAIRLPGALSFMIDGNFHSEVKGLDSIPKENQPPVDIMHFAFQIMVGLGVLMMTLSVMYLVAVLRHKRWRNSRWLLRLFVLATPLGFIAVEAGWTVTEVGRQPWIIQGIMRTSDAVTPMPGIIYSFYLFTAVYLSLAVVVTFMLYRQIKVVGKIYDIPFHLKPIKP
jgi:cytochrome d ubiquinol oxidase subunit I